MSSGITDTIKFFHMINLTARSSGCFYKIIILDTGCLHIVFFYRNQFLRYYLWCHGTVCHQIGTGCNIYLCQCAVGVLAAWLQVLLQFILLALLESRLVKLPGKSQFICQMGILQIILQTGVIMYLSS